MLAVHPLATPVIAGPGPGGFPTYIDGVFTLFGASNQWVQAYTPAAGSTLLVFALQNATTAVINNFTVTPSVTMTEVHYEPPAGGSTNMSGYAYLASTLTGSAVEHTITIDWNLNASGPMFVMEWTPAQIAAGQTVDGIVNVDGHAVPAKHRPTAVNTSGTAISVAVGIHRRSSGQGFSAMGAPWVRVDGAVSASRACHYREDWAPDGSEDDTANDSRGAIPVGDGRDNVGIYVPLESQ